MTDAKNATNATKEEHPFRPFAKWKGARRRCTNGVNSDLFFAATYLPVPIAKSLKEIEELCMTFYNQTLTQMLERAVSSVNYASDSDKTGTRKWFNDKMREGQCDLDKVKGAPPDKSWFIVKPVTVVTQAKEMKTATVETGWTQKELIAYAKANPKK